MHELSIMQNIVETVQEYVEKSDVHKVLKVIIEVGALSGVVPEALEFCFGVCAKDTVLEQAQLEIQRVPAVGRCKQCGKEFDLLKNDFTCSACEQAEWEVISGKELIIKGLEVT